jgi:A/G-specific adenine glycosylase
MASFSTLIQDWYRLNKRDLPWRHSNFVYNIWISEIILQQTQVKQGLSYYIKFINTFPTVLDLANAEEESILKLWQGLGYYSRARNMHVAAKQVVNEYNGNFPGTFKELLKLKGVGDYTAAAISSIAYNLPHAVVDGNVYRVLSRCFFISTPINSTQGKKYFNELAAQLLDKKNPGDHNQALMEVGALVCKPKNPNCIECPIQTKCIAFSKNQMLDFPVKIKKIKVKTRFFNYIITTDGSSIIIKKREESDIWRNLYDFPLLETDKKEENVNSTYSLDQEIKHILTHQHIFASFWINEVNKIEAKPNELITSITDLHNYPLPQLLIKYLESSNYFHRKFK